VLGALRGAVEDEADEIRIAAARALGSLRARGADPRLDALLALLAAPAQPERVRAAALEAARSAALPRR
jgi:HEAT repeat protein